MNKPLIVCALEDELVINSPQINILYTGIGKVNAAILLT